MSGNDVEITRGFPRLSVEWLERKRGEEREWEEGERRSGGLTAAAVVIEEDREGDRWCNTA
jgi:hypothetical protein